MAVYRGQSDEALDRRARAWFAEIRAQYAPAPAPARQPQAEPSGDVLTDFMTWLLDAGDDTAADEGD